MMIRRGLLLDEVIVYVDIDYDLNPTGRPAFGVISLIYPT
jgi:hypothetical protein